MFKKTAFFTAGLGLTLGVASADAAPVIYESFSGDAPELNGDTGGIGLTPATWTSDESITAGTATYGPNLAVSGNRVTFDEQGGGEINIGTVLSDANLMSDGDTLWFSALFTVGTAASNPDMALALGTNTLARSKNNNVPISGSGSGIGLNFKGNDRIRAATWSGGAKSNGADETVADETNHFIVGKITWGATDTVDIYLPGEDLVLGDVVSTTSAALTQSGFDVLSFSTKGADGGIDEIRFGATYADVAPAVPEPGSLALMGLGGLCVLRRRRG